MIAPLVFDKVLKIDSHVLLDISRTLTTRTQLIDEGPGDELLYLIDKKL